MNLVTHYGYAPYYYASKAYVLTITLMGRDLMLTCQAITFFQKMCVSITLLGRVDHYFSVIANHVVKE